MIVENVRRLLRPAALALLVACLVACLAFATRAAANNCADGGRSRPDEGGVGGTGLQAMGPDDEGGIGGTGISAHGDTGVIGTVTGFASICVGGVEIQYGAETPVQIDGQASTSAQLAVGQVVEVVASGSGSELSAQQITVRHVVSGPVTRVDAAHNEIDVVGQMVQLSPVTRAGGADPQGAAVTAYPLQSFVQVSGMRRSDGVVVASRVSRADPREPAQVVGPVTKLDAGIVWVAGTAVHVENAAAIAVGDEVHVVGQWDGSAIVAQSVDAIPHVPFDGRVPRVDIEGFARQTAAAQLQIGAFSVEVPPAVAQEVPRLPSPGARIRIQAVVQDRHVIVQRIGVMDELPGLPPLPPPPQRDVHAWGGGKPNDGHEGNGPPPDQSGLGEHEGPPPRAGHDMGPEKSGGFVIRHGPVVGDRPSAPQPPDHAYVPDLPDHAPVPDVPERPSAPDLPERPSVPQLPDRPPVPEIPDRPPRPERPPRPVRPDFHGRP